MKTGILFALIVIGGVVWGEVLSCDSCGRECAAACGTRQFRTCCFNYLRKRGSNSIESLSVDPSLRLELWLAHSRGGHHVAAPFSDSNSETVESHSTYENRVYETNEDQPIERM